MMAQYIIIIRISILCGIDYMLWLQYNARMQWGSTSASTIPVHCTSIGKCRSVDLDNKLWWSSKHNAKKLNPSSRFSIPGIHILEAQGKNPLIVIFIYMYIPASIPVSSFTSLTAALAREKRKKKSVRAFAQCVTLKSWAWTVIGMTMWE